MQALLTLLSISLAVAATTLEQPAVDAVLGSSTVHGCYSSAGELQLAIKYNFNSLGSCANTCKEAGAYVAATSEASCYCGQKYPPASTLVDDNKCDTPCPGYPANACGGSKAFTILNTGLKIEVDSSSDSSSSSQESITKATTSSSVHSASSSPNSAEATPTASSSLNTTFPSPSAGVSGGNSSSSVPVDNNSAVSQLSLGGLSIAALVLVSGFFM